MNLAVAQFQAGDPAAAEASVLKLLEYDPDGALVWSYGPDPTTESLSLHHAIVLDHSLGSVRLNTPPTGLAASASLICPSDRSVS